MLTEMELAFISYGFAVDGQYLSVKRMVLVR